MRHKFLIVCALSIICLSQSALAQSGRRQSKSTSPPPPPPAPTETKTEPTTIPTTGPPTAKPAAVATVIVGGDRYSSSLYIPSGYVDEAVRACMDRLGTSQALEVIGGGHMSRKDAIDRAKKETVSYVLWIEITTENQNSNDISLAYYVFKPVTAKGLTSGRVYPGHRGAGGVVVGVPTVIRRMPLEYQLREGGQQIADRVKDKLQRTATN